MKKSLILVAAGLLAMIIVTGCLGEVKKDTAAFRYYNTDPERVINASVKDEFIIAMKSYERYSYSAGWKADFNATLLKLVDEGTEFTIIADPEAGYNYWFKFKAIAVGATEVNMKYYIEFFNENDDLELQLEDWQVFTVNIN